MQHTQRDPWSVLATLQLVCGPPLPGSGPGTPWCRGPIGPRSPLLRRLPSAFRPGQPWVGLVDLSEHPVDLERARLVALAEWLTDRASLLAVRGLALARPWLPGEAKAFWPTEAMEVFAPAGWFQQQQPVLLLVPDWGVPADPDFRPLWDLDAAVVQAPDGAAHWWWARRFDGRVALLLAELADDDRRAAVRAGLAAAQREGFDDVWRRAEAEFLGDLAGERDALSGRLSVAVAHWMSSQPGAPLLALSQALAVLAEPQGARPTAALSALADEAQGGAPPEDPEAHEVEAFARAACFSAAADPTLAANLDCCAALPRNAALLGQRPSDPLRVPEPAPPLPASFDASLDELDEFMGQAERELLWQIHWRSGAGQP